MCTFLLEFRLLLLCDFLLMVLYLAFRVLASWREIVGLSLWLGKSILVGLILLRFGLGLLICKDMICSFCNCLWKFGKEICWIFLFLILLEFFCFSLLSITFCLILMQGYLCLFLYSKLISLIKFDLEILGVYQIQDNLFYKVDRIQNHL